MICSSTLTISQNLRHSSIPSSPCLKKAKTTLPNEFSTLKTFNPPHPLRILKTNSPLERESTTNSPVSNSTWAKSPKSPKATNPPVFKDKTKSKSSKTKIYLHIKHVGFKPLLTLAPPINYQNPLSFSLSI